MRRGVGGLDPESHEEDPLVRRGRRARGVDDEAAGELAVDPAVVVHRLAGRGAPVVVGARAAGLESHARAWRRAARGGLSSAGAAGRRGEAVQHERRVAQAVPDRGLDDRALGHADQRAGNLERASRFAERLDLDAGPIVRVGAERAGAELEVEGEDAVAQPAGGDAVGVGDDALRPVARPSGRPAPAGQATRPRADRGQPRDERARAWVGLGGGRRGLGAGSVGGSAGESSGCAGPCHASAERRGDCLPSVPGVGRGPAPSGHHSSRHACD